MLNSQRFAQCGHLWPLSVFKHSPVDEFQILTVSSALPLAISPVFDHATVMTYPLQCPQMSGNTYVMVVYASPPLNLRLSPGDRAKHGRKMLSPVALVVALQAQNFRSCLCADEMDAPI